MDSIKFGLRLAWAAAILAAVAAIGGFVANPYWDSPEMIREAHAADVSILVAVLILAAGLLVARRGAFAGYVVALGALGFLVYTYAFYAFDVRVTALTPLHIAIIGLAFWSMFAVVPALGSDSPDASFATRLPRRTTGVVSLVIAALFGLQWIGQMAGVIRSGQMPADLVDLNVPTNIVWALDLAFALPILVVAGVWLLRGRPWGPAIAVGWFIFGVLTAVEILAIFAFDNAAGKPLVAPVVGLFVAVLAVLAVLACVGLLPPEKGQEVVRSSGTTAASADRRP
jgi:hypothetical protein